jgi:hypothetical protein
MLDTFLDVLGNSHFEGYIGGPIAGIILAALFTALSSRPKSNSTTRTQSPHDTQIQLHQYTIHNQVINNYLPEQRSSNQSENGLPILAFSFFGGLVLVFLFAAYLPQIANSLRFFITMVATFSIASSVLSLITGQFNTPQWWLHAILPSLISIGCFWLTGLAYNAISPDVVAYAHGLLGYGPLTAKSVISGAFTFIRAINNDYTLWLLFEMSAFVFILGCAILCLVQCVFYISLANIRGDGSKFWMKIALMTEKFSTGTTTIFILILFGLAWAFATGHIFELTH